MGGQNCINCGDSETEQYDIMVRNNAHEKVALCEECHEAIAQELPE